MYIYMYTYRVQPNFASQTVTDAHGVGAHWRRGHRQCVTHTAYAQHWRRATRATATRTDNRSHGLV